MTAKAKKERPLILLGAQVDAILDGRKTEHRSVVIDQMPKYARGDRLWIREEVFIWGRWQCDGRNRKFIGCVPPKYTHKPPKDNGCIHDGGWGWDSRSAPFAPRWSSRATVEVVSVSIERVQNIDKAGVLREGFFERHPNNPNDDGFFDVLNFASYWNNAHYDTTEQRWSANPYVEVMAFKMVEEAKAKAEARLDNPQLICGISAV
ncbi:MAG: hypothetical protein O3C57_03880 [Verrucomicrobia bacterium]|nr:hypothetical protein [Verrucomicrobiota bacterium]